MTGSSGLRSIRTRTTVASASTSRPRAARSVRVSAVAGVSAVLTPEGWRLLQDLPPYDEASVLPLSRRLTDDGADPALVAAASATTRLRVGSLVYSNFRHPALLAREAATVDVLTDGRLEFGIGDGYYLPEYSQTGIELPPARARVDTPAGSPHSHQGPLVRKWSQPGTYSGW